MVKPCRRAGSRFVGIDGLFGMVGIIYQFAHQA